MKNILFLLLISINISASIINDLESAIWLSDLPTVEQLLAQGESISKPEKKSLISLATTIIQKRENLRNICESNGWVICPEVNEVSMEMLKEKHSYHRRKRFFGVLSLATLLGLMIYANIVGTHHSAENERASVTIVGSELVIIFSFALFIYNSYKSDKKEEECIMANIIRCHELYHSSVKIRQLLYKIAP